MAAPNPCGNGGNSTVHNQNEAEILAGVVTGYPTRAEGYQEDDSHLMGTFYETDVAGS
jgi:hypothetical protein